MEIIIIESFKLKDPLPQGRLIAHKGMLKHGEFFVITQNGTDYQSSEVFIGRQTLDPVKVFSVQRYRDGGTTIIYTEKGNFYFPSSLSKDKFDVPTFAAEPIDIL